MAKIFAIANQKGGVGKTTTAINLSACLAERGKRVLVVDMDSQGNATSGLGVDKNNCERTLYDLMIDDEVAIQDCIVHTEFFETLDIIPSSINLAGIEIELYGVENKHYIFKEAIQKVADDYDYIMIDCPPNLNIQTLNAFAAADYVLIAVQCEYLALEGLGLLLKTIGQVQQVLNPDLKVDGVVFTMFDGRTNLSLQVVEEVKNKYDGDKYNTIIPRNIRLSESPSYGEPINIYDPRCTGAVAYGNLADEMIEKRG